MQVDCTDLPQSIRTAGLTQLEAVQMFWLPGHAAQTLKDYIEGFDAQETKAVSSKNEP